MPLEYRVSVEIELIVPVTTEDGARPDAGGRDHYHRQRRTAYA
jgi:hypothetical protein